MRAGDLLVFLIDQGAMFRLGFKSYFYQQSGQLNNNRLGLNKEGLDIKLLQRAGMIFGNPTPTQI